MIGNYGMESRIEYNGNMETDSFIIRRVNSRKDIHQVPDLIETCFGQWLDPDGAGFIEEMREVSRFMKAHPLISRLEPVPYPMEGVVAETKDGKIIGNISYFEMTVNGEKAALIANVCVSPEHSGRHIASQMLEKIFSLAKEKHAKCLYLQARLETPNVITMYHSRGFQTLAKRESWIFPKGGKIPGEPVTWLSFVRPDPSMKPEFQKRFNTLYPASIRWDMNYRKELFRFGRFGALMNKLSGKGDIFQQVMDEDGVPLTSYAYQTAESFANTLWLIPETDCSDEKLGESLRFILQAHRGKAVSLNLPLGQYVNAIKAAGFIPHNRLVWMKYTFSY